MPKGIPNKQYTAEFKRMVIKTLQKEKLEYHETTQRFEIKSDRQVRNWECVYLTEGPEDFTVNSGDVGVKVAPGNCRKE